VDIARIKKNAKALLAADRKALNVWWAVSLAALFACHGLMRAIAGLIGGHVGSVAYAAGMGYALLFASALQAGVASYIYRKRCLPALASSAVSLADKAPFVFCCGLPLVAFSVFGVGGALFALPAGCLAVGILPCVIADSDKSLPARQALALAWAAQKPYRKGYGRLLLSFAGWFALSLASFGLAWIYVGPYWALARAIAYEEMMDEFLKDTMKIYVPRRHAQ